MMLIGATAGCFLARIFLLLRMRTEVWMDAPAMSERVRAGRNQPSKQAEMWGFFAPDGRVER
jgi:hypothetical protein